MKVTLKRVITKGYSDDSHFLAKYSDGYVMESAVNDFLPVLEKIKVKTMTVMYKVRFLSFYGKDLQEAMLKVNRYFDYEGFAEDGSYICDNGIIA